MVWLTTAVGIWLSNLKKRSTDTLPNFKASAIVLILTQLFALCRCVVYNKALSTTAGGMAHASSSPSSTPGYEPIWAIDGVVTFCNSGGTACPGPYLNKMYKSPTALSTNDV
jgi:hypothetical protein